MTLLEFTKDFREVAPSLYGFLHLDPGLDNLALKNPDVPAETRQSIAKQFEQSKQTSQQTQEAATPLQNESLDVKSNEKVNDFNNRLLAMCNTIGVHCIDTNTALKNESGALKEDYWSYDTLALSKEAYSAICEYILTHTA